MPQFHPKLAGMLLYWSLMGCFQWYSLHHNTPVWPQPDLLIKFGVFNVVAIVKFHYYLLGEKMNREIMWSQAVYSHLGIPLNISVGTTRQFWVDGQEYYCNSIIFSLEHYAQANELHVNFFHNKISK